MRILLLCSLLVLSAACGSSSSQEATTPKPDEKATPVEPSETPEEKFARQTDDAIDKMCQRLTDCSVEDARANMSGKELEELERDLPAIIPKAIDECKADYGKTPLSPRQVVGVRACLSEATECPVFAQCLEGAAKGES